MNVNQNVKTPWRYLAQETGLFFILSYAIFFGSSQGSLTDPTFLVISVILFGLLLRICLSDRSQPHTGLGLPALAVLLTQALAVLFSIDPRRSVIEFWLFSIMIFILLLTAELVRRGLPGELVVKVLLLVGAIFMGLSWFEAGNWYASWLAANPGHWLPAVSYRLPAPNFLCVILNVWLMLAIARLLQTCAWLSRVLLGLWIISALGLIFLTSSRGGWLGTAAGLACLIIMAALQRREALRQRWMALKKRPALLAGLAVALFIVAGAVGFVLVRQATGPTHGSLADARSQFWPEAWQAFIRSPLVGVGPFTFVSLFMRANSVPPVAFYDYAHNVTLDLLSGSGLLGFGAVLWLGFMIVLKLFRKLRVANNLEWTVLAGALAALAAFAVHGMFDSVHETVPTSGWNLMIVLGAALGTATATDGVPASWKRWPRVTLLAGLLVVGLYGANLWLLQPYQAAVKAGEQQQWSEAVQGFALAAQRDPGLAAAWQQLGYSESQLAAGDDQIALPQAIAAFKHAVEIDPYWGLNHANLAALYRTDGDLADAEREFKLALADAPGCALYSLNLAIVQEQNGAAQDALVNYLQTLDLQPAWAGATFWRSTALRAQALSTWQSRQAPGAPQDLQTLQAALAGNHDLGDAYLPVIAEEIKFGQLDAAQRDINQARFAYFNTTLSHAELVWLSAELAAEQGKLDEASQAGEVALAGFDHQGIFGPGTASNAGYLTYIFRRPGLPQELVPQMQLIPLTDTWALRQIKLAGWERTVGNAAKADALLQDLTVKAPDVVAK
jgi:O-antigen ligase/tetratricopeptide (TPR) repeat protein